MRQCDGVAWTSRVLPPSIAAASRRGSTVESCSSSTVVAPRTSGSSSSRNEMSNMNVVSARSSSPGDSGSRASIAPRKLASAPCEICTPFGRPVLPEV